MGQSRHPGSASHSSTSGSPHPSHRPQDPVNDAHPPPPPRDSTSEELPETILPGNVARMMLPPLGADADTLLAVGRKLDQNVPDAPPLRHKAAMPEKCISFCTQRVDAPAFCRMLCLRKRTLPEKREEVLKRLRPPNMRQAQLQQNGESSAMGSMSSASAQSSEPSFWSGWSFSPFESLKKRIEPYSLIYVRGMPDGVVGRYMEELEYDDGIRDFGEVSRGADEANRRRRIEPGPVWMEWGAEGALLHVPLLYYLRPWLSFSETVDKATAPARNLLKMYTTSFTDGSQARSIAHLSTELSRGAAFEMAGKMRDYWTKQIAERKEEMAKLRKEVMATREAEIKAALERQQKKKQEITQDEAAVKKVMDQLNRSKRARDEEGKAGGPNEEEGIRR